MDELAVVVVSEFRVIDFSNFSIREAQGLESCYSLSYPSSWLGYWLYYG